MLQYARSDREDEMTCLALQVQMQHHLFPAVQVLQGPGNAERHLLAPAGTVPDVSAAAGFRCGGDRGLLQYHAASICSMMKGLAAQATGAGHVSLATACMHACLT